MTNIAEGFARKSSRDFAHFLDVARASTIETQSLLYVALDAGYLQASEFDHLYRLTNATASLIAGFTRHLRSAPQPSAPRTPYPVLSTSLRG
jgi:four helix bundle protein